METKGFFRFEIIINVLVRLTLSAAFEYVMGLRALYIFYFYTSKSDVCGRQILAYKDGPRAERVN